MPVAEPTKFASRKVRPEFIEGLEVVSQKVYDLPGAVFERTGERDSRLSLGTQVGLGGSNKVCYYEHIASIHHKKSGMIYVVFRETMDALLARQSDLEKYPKWLIEEPKKQKERSIFIHVARPNALQLIRSGRIQTHQDWLDAIAEPWVFDSIAYYLLTRKIITEEMYRDIK